MLCACHTKPDLTVVWQLGRMCRTPHHSNAGLHTPYRAQALMTQDVDYFICSAARPSVTVSPGPSHRAAGWCTCAI
eukprot:364839-Chlamydomonas_euryale.AAC.4